MTVIAPRGISTEMFFKLCVRAPFTASQSLPCLCAPADDVFFFSMRYANHPVSSTETFCRWRGRYRRTISPIQNSDQQPATSTVTDFVIVEPLSVVQEMVYVDLLVTLTVCEPEICDDESPGPETLQLAI